MSPVKTDRLPANFNRLAWSNLAAQSAEQIALAAAPIVAVLSLGVAEAETGLLQTALTAPFVLFAIPAGLLTDHIPRRTLMAGAEGDPRAGKLSAASCAAAAGVRDPVHFQRWLVLAACGIRALCRAPSRAIGDGRRHHALRCT